MTPALRRRHVLALLPEALLLAAGNGLAQAPAPAAGPAASSPAAAGASPFGALVGRWVRPDGGYVITIRGVDGLGRIDAVYANPNPLPFYRADAAPEGNGKGIKLYFELRAGGYDGSSYSLVYDAEKDVLNGVYFQAVARQRFDVVFQRVKA